MTPPDQLDLEALEQFLRSHIGEVYRKRLVELAKRYVGTCQNRRSSMEDVRASQGAIEALCVVNDLPETLRKELAARNKEKKLNDGK